MDTLWQLLNLDATSVPRRNQIGVKKLLRHHDVPLWLVRGMRAGTREELLPVGEIGMNTWLTERELRDSKDERDLRDSQDDNNLWPGLTINVAFLQDIKTDSNLPDESIDRIKELLSNEMECTQIDPAPLAKELNRLRDELETYFALEEFYGYFDQAKINRSRVSIRAETLKSQHVSIYLEVCELAELAESAQYQEIAMEQALPAIVAGFHSFVQSFQCHEQEEADLMLQLSNQDLGGSG